jgi:pimeloyl-ACP methyl ester carboxylesterase
VVIERTVLSGGVRLTVHDHGGPGRPVLLLHGLAGHSGEWDTTAAWMSERYRVIALDQRGQGVSERHPADVSRAAYVADVIAVIEDPRQEEVRDGGDSSARTLGAPRRPEPVVLVGQSLGGHTAMLVAAARPDLVRALVLVEASPGLPDPGSSRPWTYVR